VITDVQLLSSYDSAIRTSKPQQNAVVNECRMRLSHLCVVEIMQALPVKGLCISIGMVCAQNKRHGFNGNTQPALNHLPGVNNE
jgi:hypothetical protein